MKNENKHNDMVDIMTHLQQYVPTQSTVSDVSDPKNDEEFQVTLDKFHYILFGGDQLTVERAMGAKKERNNENRGVDRLEVMIPVIEDWHTKVCLLKVRMSNLLHKIL